LSKIAMDNGREQRP